MNKESFVLELNKRGINCDEKQLNLLWDFMRHVLKTNESFNLTAIKDEESFVEKMIFDSALLLNNQNFEDVDILDIGAGAGFPSVVLSILSPKAHVFALDSTAKKVKFIEDYAKEKSLDVTGISARAEEFARDNRDRFMVVTARAVASLRILIELALPLLKVGGVLIAMKGPGFEDEIKEAQGALKKLKGEVDYIYEDQLPESKEARSFIYIKKVGETPNKYPRSYVEIKNKALYYFIL